MWKPGWPPAKQAETKSDKNVPAGEDIKALMTPGDDSAGEAPWPAASELESRVGTSIDFRLGRWFRSFKQTRTKSVSLAEFDAERTVHASEISRTKQHFVPFGDSYVLHPDRFVLGVTLEWLQLPAGLSGYITGKSSLGRHCLVIETAAGLHSHFSGCLTLEMANIGEVPLEVCPGMEICQIFLHRVTLCKVISLGAFSDRRKPRLSLPQADKMLRRIREKTDGDERGTGGIVFDDGHRGVRESNV